MTKVSLVGVDGSGKTVLMAVLGDKYQSPDARGLFLSPSDQDTFDFAKRHLADLRGGHWPMRTNGNRRLSWMLCQRHGANVAKICDLSLLDYPGEAFRLSFGSHTKDEFKKVNLDAGEVAAFRQHVQDSQVIVLVVNLSFIVNAAPDDERAWETQWLVKAMLDEAETKGKASALVFTRADAHGALIADGNGLPDVITRWLPQVASLHANVPAFAVAAVDRTIPSESGHPQPSADFGSQGLEPLVDWMARTAQRCEHHGKLVRKGFMIILFSILGGLCVLSWWTNDRERRAAEREKIARQRVRLDNASDGLNMTETLSQVNVPSRRSLNDVIATSHADVLNAATESAMEAINVGDFKRACKCLQIGKKAYHQGRANGESPVKLMYLGKRWEEVMQRLQQKQCQNPSCSNPFSNDDMVF